MIRRFALAAVPILAGWTTSAAAAVAVADPERLWLEGEIPYAVCETAVASKPGPSKTDTTSQSGGCPYGGRSLSPRTAIKVRNAVAEWNALFGDRVRFVPVDRLRRFQRGVLFSRSAKDIVCSTNRIGRPRTARRTIVKLGDHCNSLASAQTPVGTILHEMMHVAGFYHEQQRPDRDAFVKPHVPDGLVSVLLDIGGANQWVKGTGSMRVLSGYDFQSIMHYPIRGHRKAELTLEGLQRLDAQGLVLSTTGQRHGLSANDIAGLRLLYAPRQRGNALAIALRGRP